MSAELSERDFESAADRTLHALDGALTDQDDFDVELTMGILTIELGDGAKYVVNSHRAARQIWMAAERTAWHFDLEPETGRWIASKTGDELWSTIGRVLGEKLGRPLQLVHP